MNILVGCEESQAVTSAFHRLGHHAISCDIMQPRNFYPHLCCDVRDIINYPFDILIAFPPCTYLAQCQMHLSSNPIRMTKTEEAFQFVKTLWNSSIPRISIENPIGYLNTHWMPPTQIISPHMFGDLYYKPICLWLKNLPVLVPSIQDYVGKSYKYISPSCPRLYHVSNHTNSRMSQAQKSMIKSSWLYFPKLCQSMASQWSNLS